ncbi:sulfurtransferase TusA family protein [Methanoculleus horonobensis]|jgi:TusA-related sulfurtransferase|uniref:sulfurtransferase TusA family protein n=1 Tax=Methanoculleus horonobensis TaxID=528314 RepID=UPI00082D8995|nr:sulfurtransferase TusA family protein [Methanoculleus horonobensis]MDD3070758.1 sulfurtransferase TusA family protein [Methanoculleus horonobensis]
MYADRTVNCVGSCQSPLLLIEEEMEVLEKGQVLQVTADRPDLVEMVRSWADKSGHKVEEEHVASGVTTLIVRKGAAPAVEAT